MKAALGGLAVASLPISVPRAEAKEAYLIWRHPYQRPETAYLCPSTLDGLFKRLYTGKVGCVYPSDLVMVEKKNAD